MGKKDTITKEYLKDPVIFADAFNQFLYHGRQVIKPEALTELDTTEIALPYGSGMAGVPEQKYRDVLKLMMTDGQAAYCLLGIEGSSDIHYALPVKNLLYDSIQLAHQVTNTAKSHRQKSTSKNAAYKPSSDEYLSGFYKTDRLLPVVTLTIFWGTEKWDAPLTLREMYAPAETVLLQYVPNYTVNLIAPEQLSEEAIKEFQTSLKEVMLYIKYSQNKEKLHEIMQANPGFQSLDRLAAEVINVTTNSKLHYPEGKETIDMCLAIEEMRRDSRMEGIQEGELRGTVKTCKQFHLSLQETIQYIAEHFSFSLSEAAEKVANYWD